MNEGKRSVPLGQMLLCGGAILFTVMNFLVQMGVLPEFCYGVVYLFLLGVAFQGFRKNLDGRAFLRPSVIGGGAILAFAAITLTHPTPLDQKIFDKLMIFLIFFPCCWVFLAGLRMFLQGYSVKAIPKGNPIFPALAIFLQTALTLSLYWVKWFPSGVSPDTRHQWGQIHGTLRLNDIHALGHTIFLKGILSVVDSYAAVIFVQILLISLLYALFARFFAKKGVSLGIMLLLNAFSLSYGEATRAYMFPWKDTPYTFAVGILTLLLFYLLDKSTSFTLPKAVLFGVAIAFTTLFRLNGIVILLAVGIWAIVYFCKRKEWKRLLAAGAAVVVCFVSVNWYGYGVLKAESPTNGFSIQVFGSGLAAMLTQGRDQLSDDDRAEIRELLSPTWMAQYYTPWDTRQLIWKYETNDPEGVFQDPNMEILVNNFVLDLGEHRSEVIKLYFKLMPKAFMVCLRDVLYNTYKVWGFSGVWQVYLNNIFLLVLLMVGVGARWNRLTIKRRFIVFVPVIGNAVSIAISTITNEDRYLLPTVTLTWVLLVYLLLFDKKEQEEAPEIPEPLPVSALTQEETEPTASS